MRHLKTAMILLMFSLPAAAEPMEPDTTYSKEEITSAVEEFFGEGAENLGEVVGKVFKDHGRPNGYIKGEEVAAALGVGVRYGRGSLHLKNGTTIPKLYWQGPSIGFDAGANASKVFILTYKLDKPAALFQRYPGVEGSLYFVGGVGVNYLQSGDTILAPVRFGAGWRQGVSAGYMDFTREASLIPF